MIKIKKTLKFYSLPLLSSILMGTSYIPFPPWAIFFCYVPLWTFALKQEKIKPVLIGAWLCQFIATLIGFNWVAYTIREFGFFSWPLAILGLLIFASFANLHIPIALFFWFISRKQLFFRQAGNSKIEEPVFNKNEYDSSLNSEYDSTTSKSNQNKKTHNFFFSSFFPALFTLLTLPLYSALVMRYYPMIFDWNFGYTWFYAGWPAFQTAEIWGFKFLHTLTLFFNLPFLYFFMQIRQAFKQNQDRSKTFFWLRSIKYCQCSLLIIGVCTLGFAGLNIYGQYLKNRWPKPDQTASILLIQPNIKNLSVLNKQSQEYLRSSSLKKLITQTLKSADRGNIQENIQGNKQKPNNIFEENISENIKENLKGIDFILWPEGAYLYSIKHDTKIAQNNFAQRQAKKWQTTIVLSAIGKNKKETTNSIFVFNKEGTLVEAPYNKTLLLAFGEYMPGEKWLPVKKLFSYYGRSFTRGTGEHKVISLNGTNLGFQICYEGLFDFFTRDLAREKAQIIVNVTNDSWYGSWQEPYQHLYITLSRAIEVRRPLIRGTNTGISGFISAKGEIGPLSSINKSDGWIQPATYSSQGKQTIFTKWGYYIDQCFLWTLFAGLLCLYFLAVFRF